MAAKNIVAQKSEARLDKFLSELKEVSISRSQAQKLIRDGLISVQGRAKVKASYQVKQGDIISLKLDCDKEGKPILKRDEVMEIKPEPMHLNIVYEDEHLVVINKEPGVMVHPCPGHWNGTLVNGLLHHFKNTLNNRWVR